MNSLGVPFHAVVSIKVPKLRRKVVDLVHRLSGRINRATLLALLGLSRIRFASWSRSPVPCSSSPLDRCRRSYPVQLTTTELRRIKSAFSDPAYAHWPAASIAWKASDSVSGMGSVALITAAFANLTSIPEQDISLIVDGGSENNKRHDQAFLNTVPMKKLIAQFDVSFSNSMIEAVNKTLKYRYLFRKPMGDLDHLQTAITLAVTDYNAQPHYALQGLTTDEAYRGMVFDKNAYRDRLQKAREKRLLENRKTPHPRHPWEGEDNAVLETFFDQPRRCFYLYRSCVLLVLAGERTDHSLRTKFFYTEP